MSELNGVINIYKEKEYTSHDVVAIIRGVLKGQKVGHTGTLDPNAQGVLPICVGKATKISQFLMDTDKVYSAEVILGVTTDTEDNTGNIISQSEVNISEDVIQSVVSSFFGDYNQVPPMYSAIKINGERLYKLARKGEVVERKTRLVTIKDIKINKFLQKDKFIITVKCSKGTYVRTLCKDIGEKLGCGATMGELTRVASGNFKLENSIKINQFKNIVSEKKQDEIIIPIDRVLLNKKITINPEANKLLYNGNKVPIKYILEDIELDIEEEVLVYDFKNKLISISKIIMQNDIKIIKPISIFI
jgi:tRNA pseudouridine55 synthase